MFDTTTLIIGGVLTGLVFGFLLQKGHVTRYSTIVGQFLFTDFTVLKIMLTAIVTGAIGIYGMYSAGMITQLHVKPLLLAANALGGLIFGIGMTLAGYCPGTGVAAIGEGSRHAIYAVLGMIVGAGVYAEVYPSLQNNLLKWADYKKITLADATGLSPWVFVAGLAIVAGAVFVLIERKEGRCAAALPATVTGR
ncbi:MAG TPA: YeeE/YedE thiosulfate transporter family protein [Planctomycetota bacterium]|jgi:hypothetical protein